MKLIYSILLLLSLILSFFYYSHETYTFNEELIVAICFTIFVALTIKSINTAITNSMQDRADQIAEEYNVLQRSQEQNLKLLISYYDKYSQLIENLQHLFTYAVSKGFEMNTQRRTTSIGSAYSIVLNGFNTLLLLEKIYLLKYKYYFVSRFYNKLNNIYTENSSDLVEYLNSINYISKLNTKKSNSKILKNINIITSSI